MQLLGIVAPLVIKDFHVTRVTWKSLITSGATMPSNCMSMPSHTSTIKQTARVAHWKARIGAREIASLKVMAVGAATAASSLCPTSVTSRPASVEGRGAAIRAGLSMTGVP